MTDRISFRINGEPRSWKAPQFNRKTGSAYKPKQEKVWQESIWGQAMPYAPAEPWTGPVGLIVRFRFPMPKTWPKWKKAKEQVWHDSSPDLSNLVKALEDALKGVFFEDDRQVVSCRAQKTRWAGAPCVDVRMYRLPGLPETRAEAKGGGG